MISFDYNLTVYYKDVDQMGIVYYARYLEYFEAARTEMLRSIGVMVTEIEKEGYYLPVVSAHCDYKKGAHFEDKLIVKTSIHTLPAARMKIDYLITRDAELLVEGYTIHGFTNHDGKPKRPPKSFINTLTPFFK
ncbi:MAG: acyl-CoA thioesterase [Fidelibacterota bacterium]